MFDKLYILYLSIYSCSEEEPNLCLNKCCDKNDSGDSATRQNCKSQCQDETNIGNIPES